LTSNPASGHSEQPFWQRAGASWRQLAGGFSDAGFSFEWHDWNAGNSPLPWARSFHSGSIEICLNLQGSGWVACDGGRIELTPGAAGFFAIQGGTVRAERSGGQHHQFLSVEYSVAFLRDRLAAHTRNLHPVVQRCLEAADGFAGISSASPLTHRHRDLLNSLFRPPVLASAQRLWFEVKALEFAAEFFFSAIEGETLCTRAQRLAGERVARAKQILLEDLAEPPSLEELGRKVGCSHFYLSRTFTRETGTTISQWLRRARLERAAELLRSGKCNVTETAMEVGYSSLSHFSEAFHEMFGCCPGLYPLRTSTQKQSDP
jgi:AraC-like DNA-binding protein